MRQPSLKLSLIGTLGAIVILFLGLLILHLDITLLLFLDMIYVAMVARVDGLRVSDLIEGMSAGCAQALTGLLFFPLVGALIGVWIHCGTIPTLLYHGLNILHPRYFLISSFLMCSLVALIIGTSWGTVGTIGIVIMGVAKGGGIDLPAGLIVGSIVSGAWFGDKMSPISDSTLLTTTVAKVDVYPHIRAMACTTLPTYALTFLVFSALNRVLASEAEMDAEILRQMQTGLSGQYELSFLTFIPPLILMLLCFFQVHVFVALLSGIGSGVVCSILVQQSTFSAAMGALMSGENTRTGVSALDNLLSWGGIDAMVQGFYLCLLAVCLGGALQRTGFLSSVISHSWRYLKSDFALILSTMFTCVLGNCIFSDNYLSIVLNGDIYRELYQKYGLSFTMLSRTIEESATLSAPLIPWTAAGVFISETLGVPVREYAPFVILNLLNPVVSLCMCRLRIGVITQEQEKNPRPKWYQRYKIRNNLRNKLLLSFLLISIVPTTVLSLSFHSMQADMVRDQGMPDGFELGGLGVFQLAVIMVVVSVCTACIISNKISCGIRALAEDMEKLQAGDFQSPPPPDVGDDEIGMLNCAFHQMKTELDKLINKTLRLQISERDARLKALQSQISPHFLYNALDSINWELMEKEEYEISEILLALSDMLHYSLDQYSSQVFLSVEFFQAENYLKIQKNRFADRFDYMLDCPKELEEQMVPRMLLQPIVENAVSHGLENQEHGVVQVSAERAGAMVRIIVEDSGRGISAEQLAELRRRLTQEEYAGEQGAHIGLVNVSHRLRYMYGDESRLLLESQEGRYTRVIVEIPADSEVEYEDINRRG